MEAIPGLVELNPISLASLEPSVNPKSEITATVASLWPYSSSALKLTAIIVELDYKKRENRGELKVSFHGYAAESLKTLTIGNVLKISLEGATWEGLPDPEERDVPWQLKWERRLRVKVFKDNLAKEPKIEVDKTFDQAHRSGIFDRIAAAEAIISESQLEQNEGEDFEGQTPPKQSQLPTSWSTSFRDSTAGDSQTPINIFAQGRRRLFSLGSDDEEDDIDADRSRKKPRLFEPHQSFRYVSDLLGDAERGQEEQEEEPQFAKRTEDQFFDENSFRESFRGRESIPTPRLYVRSDDSGDITVESEAQRAALGDKQRGSKLYVRPDDSQADDVSGLSTQSMTSQGTEDSKRRTADMEEEIFKIIFGQPPEPPAVAPQLDEDGIFSRSLTEFTDQETFSAQASLIPQEELRRNIFADPPIEVSAAPPFQIVESTTPPFPPQKSTTPPFEMERSFTPPLPEGLHPLVADSQPMSSFTLDASQNSRPIASEMPPPAPQPRPTPRLDTLFSDRFDPITPVLKPTASPALPLPSPFPSSALEKGTISFFPSRLSQSFTSSETQDTQIKGDKKPEEPAAELETAAAAIEQLEKAVQVQQRAVSQEATPTESQQTIESQTVEKIVEITRETITVIEHASSVVDPESPRQPETGKVDDIGVKGNHPATKPSQPEIIEILDSSDEEPEDDEEDDEEDEEDDEDDDEDEDEDEEDEDEDEDEVEDEDEEEEHYEESGEEYRDTEEEKGKSKERRSQERYEEALAAANDEEDYYVEDDEYPKEGEITRTQIDEGEDEDEDEDADADEYEDNDEMDYRYRHEATPSPDIEERESPFVSDDDDPPKGYRAPKVGESPISSRSPISYISPSHRTVGTKVAVLSPSVPKQTHTLILATPALRRSVYLDTPNVAPPEPPISTTPTASHPISTRAARTSFSPEPYVPQSPSSSPSQPRTPRQGKPDVRTPKLEDNGFEFVESPVNHKVPPAVSIDSYASSQLKKKRGLPWLTPQVLTKHKQNEDNSGSNTVPQKLRTPTADTKIAIEEMIQVAKKLRGQDPTRKPIIKPKLDINPDAIRRFREYNATCGISGGVITSLSEFVPVQSLLKIEWGKIVDLLAVNLREGEITQYEKSPKFFELKLWVIDPSCGNGKPVPVTLVRPYQTALPKTVKPGDVVLLRNINIKSQDNQRCGFSGMASGWKLWRPSRAQDGQQQMVAIPHDGPNAECGAEEIAYVSRLWEWWRGIDVDIRVYLINKKERGSRKSEATNA
ncbi:hypothetical protein TWF718_008840 [Orbilia javanica]|uniref:Telomeric single stranded DNA binding POT1/Cdc13 domain-containing protein n=1 Tax=Orbilia javanica TaxID=47235 RepID=A0AAN8MV45_9PEZI